MSDINHPTSSISIYGLIFLQLLPTVVGFTIVFGWLTHQMLRFELSQYDEAQFEALRQQEDRIARIQVEYEDKSFGALLNDVCSSLDCKLNTLVLSTDSKELLPKEQLKLILEIDVLNIPLILEVLRRHPQQWMLQGLEVHTYKEPAKIQVRLSRYTVPKVPMYPAWLSQLGWTEQERSRLEIVYAYWLASTWQKRKNVSRAQNTNNWNQLFKTINRDLWNIHLSKGSLVYTVEGGMEFMPLQIIE